MTAMHAADMSAHDVWNYRPEFRLHFVRCYTEGASTAVVVEEYSFPLHVAADAWLDVDVAL